MTKKILQKLYHAYPYPKWGECGSSFKSRIQLVARAGSKTWGKISQKYPKDCRGSDLGSSGKLSQRSIYQSHRIHVLYGIYGNIYHQYTPNVSINLPYMEHMGIGFRDWNIHTGALQMFHDLPIEPRYHEPTWKSRWHGGDLHHRYRI